MLCMNSLTSIDPFDLFKLNLGSFFKKLSKIIAVITKCYLILLDTLSIIS